MSMYLPNDDVRATGAEAGEFVDAGAPEDAVPVIEQPVRTSRPADEAGESSERE